MSSGRGASQAFGSAVNEVRNTGRNAQGVRLVNLDAADVVCSVARVITEKEEEGSVGGDAADDGAAPNGDEEEL